MIDIDLKYQAALFGSYEDISPTPHNIKYFLDKFEDKGLIPSTFQEFGPNGAINRFNLSSDDQVWVIEFSSTRIDISKTNKNVGVTEMGFLDQFIKEVYEIVSIINAKFPKKHHRLSLITRYLLPPMDSESMTEIYTKLSNPIALYKEHAIAEWTSRTVSRINYHIGEKEELFNVISQVKRTIGTLTFDSKIEHVDRIELQFDINTYQGNTEYRFDLDTYHKFLDTVTKIESRLKEDYIKLIES